MKYRLRLTVEMEYESDVEITDPHFFFEENHCRSNVIDQLAAQVEADDEKNICNICARSRVEYLGEVTT